MRLALAALALVPAAASAQQYTVVVVSAPDVAPQPAPATNPLHLGDDSTAAVSLGFAFPFYGQTFTQAYVSSNGFINFTQDFNGCCAGQPMASAPRNGIYGYWTDLISSTGPSVQTSTAPSGDHVFSARWQSYEYGTNTLENFSIQIDQSGRIAVTYGATGNTFHTVSAGITGPGPADNIQFYYGSDRNPLAYTAFGLTPVQAVNCSITPSDPRCTVVPSVTPAPPAAVTPTVAAAVVADTAPAAQTVAQTTAAPQKDAERLTPDQLKALIAGGAPISIPGAAQQAQTQAKTAVVTSDFTGGAQAALSTATAQSTLSQQASASGGPMQAFSAISDPVMRDPLALSSASASAAADAATQAARPSALSAQQSAIAAIAMMPAPKAVQREADAAPTPQDAQVAAIAVPPQGFTAYQAKRMADAAFYAPRDIYKRQKPIDAYMTLYRLLQSGDRRWEAMTEAQYGKQ